ncbi:hypothetical protein DL770_011691 [Monosporascus sp. CRB-9-2]|nr:hypothetical protein DL770_011691 [Monosporascus sp. CRB-9-2]
MLRLANSLWDPRSHRIRVPLDQQSVSGVDLRYDGYASLAAVIGTQVDEVRVGPDHGKSGLAEGSGDYGHLIGGYDSLMPEWIAVALAIGIVSQADDLERQEGYITAARWLARDADDETFIQLSAVNLLYMQSEILELEKGLDDMHLMTARATTWTSRTPRAHGRPSSLSAASMRLSNRVLAVFTAPFDIRTVAKSLGKVRTTYQSPYIETEKTDDVMSGETDSFPDASNTMTMTILLKVLRAAATLMLTTECGASGKVIGPGENNSAPEREAAQLPKYAALLFQLLCDQV